MGSLFKQAEKHLKIAPGDIFVEIGTAKGWGGSTHYFAELAKRNQSVLHTVDINNRYEILQYVPNSVGYWMPGSKWAIEVLPTLNSKIGCLYLDNYDYNYWIEDKCQMIQDQKKEYLELHNINLNNTDCQVEHLKQMIGLLPYMSNDALVVCDDTYMFNDCWIGKCGAVVPYLLIHGYKIVEIEHVEGQSYGVMLKKT